MLLQVCARRGAYKHANAPVTKLGVHLTGRREDWTPPPKKPNTGRSTFGMNISQNLSCCVTHFSYSYASESHQGHLGKNGSAFNNRSQ